MWFKLWLDPDVEPDQPVELLDFALDSIANTPGLSWDIVADDGTVLAKSVTPRREVSDLRDRPHPQVGACGSHTDLHYFNDDCVGWRDVWSYAGRDEEDS